MGPEVMAAILPRIYPQMLDEVHAHQDAGRPTFIVSAAGNGVVEPLADVLGMDGGIGTRYEVDADGAFTGRFDGPFVYGEGKVEAMRGLRRRARHRPRPPPTPTPTRSPTCRCCARSATRSSSTPTRRWLEIATRRGLADDALRAARPPPGDRRCDGGRCRRRSAGFGGSRIAARRKRPPRRFARSTLSARLRLDSAAWRVEPEALAPRPDCAMATSRGAKPEHAEREAEFATMSGQPVEALYTPTTWWLRPRARPRRPRGVPVHPRRPADDVPRPPLDDADVRGFRHAGADQRALQVPPRPGADRPLDRLRFPDPDGLRLRSPLPGRSRRGASPSTPSGHGGPVRRDPARQGDDVDDDQRPGVVLLCFYIASPTSAASRKLGGTVQNDCLKEFIAQHAWLVPPGPAMRIVTDMIEFCSREVPRWNPVSISGYHIREAGSTAAQELAFTLADGLAYVESAWSAASTSTIRPATLLLLRRPQRLLRGDRQVPRGAPHLGPRDARALRREAESMKLRTHAQTAGVSLTAQQPHNNVVRASLRHGRGARRDPVAPHQLARRDLALPTEKA